MLNDFLYNLKILTLTFESSNSQVKLTIENNIYTQT